MSGYSWADVSTGDYFKWEKIGQRVEGEIVSISSHTFPATNDRPANTVPVLEVEQDDGDTVEVTCSNMDLVSQLKALAPQVGQSISMEYLRDVPTSFGGTKKIFLVRLIDDTPPPRSRKAKAVEPVEDQIPF